MMKLIFLLLIAAALGGLFIFSRPAQAADPIPVACPQGQTVFLVGRAQPGEALLIMVRGRVVGGGVADQAGRYRLPLQANERPGIYPGAILNRATRGTLARFDCYVNVPLPEGSVPPPNSAPPAPAETAVFDQPTTQPTATPRPTIANVPTPTLRPTTPGGPTATLRPTTPGGPTATPRPTTPGGPTATPRPTVPAAIGIVRIVEIKLRADGSQREFVQILNPSTTNAVPMGNWRLINASRPADVPPFIFPAFTLGSELNATIYSANGISDLSLNEFYWNQTEDIWRIDDVAELRDAANNLIFTFTVTDQN